MPTGLVVKQEANFYSVAFDETVYLCTMRANIKKAGVQIKVGDRVELDELQAERPVIIDIHTRQNELQKPAIANVDQVLIVMSCLQPDFNPLLVDRLLLWILYEGLEPVICISKADLIDEDLEDFLKIEYEPFQLHLISTLTQQGLAELIQTLSGHVTVMAGASGVGKTSLINYLNPAIHMMVGEVNQIGIGKHTTRHVSLHAIGQGKNKGWLADSPGFNNLQMPPIEPADLGTYYPEFKPYLGQCQFNDCLHASEIGCAVKDNIDTESERYFMYLRLLDEAHELSKERLESAKEETLTKRAIGKNRRDEVLKLGTEGRARSRRVHRQMIEQVSNWSEVDEDMLEELNPDEWRI